MSDFQKPYMYANFKKAMETIMESEVAATAKYSQSQYKKPYIYDDYPTMEWEYSDPGYAPWKPKYGPGMFADCQVQGDALGGGIPNICEPGLQCGVWVFSCAHRIKSFKVLQSFGWIQSIQYFKDDTVRVTVCWDEKSRAPVSSGGVGAEVKGEGKSVVSKIDLTCVGPGNECASCQECQTGGKVPAITYTTQQMSVNGTQALSTTGGGGGPYRWTIQSGGGTISPTVTKSGQSTTYTAPSVNPSCTLNPTIRVTDFCGFYKELKIAVNGYSNLGAIAYRFASCNLSRSCAYQSGFGYYCTYDGWSWYRNYNCVSTSMANQTACQPYHCGAPGDTYYISCAGCPNWNTYGTCAAADCCELLSEAVQPCAACGPGPGTDKCVCGNNDTRTASMITGGCCPAALL